MRDIWSGVTDKAGYSIINVNFNERWVQKCFQRLAYFLETIYHSMIWFLHAKYTVLVLRPLFSPKATSSFLISFCILKGVHSYRHHAPCVQREQLFHHNFCIFYGWDTFLCLLHILFHYRLYCVGIEVTLFCPRSQMHIWPRLAVTVQSMRKSAGCHFRDFFKDILWKLHPL